MMSCTYTHALAGLLLLGMTGCGALERARECQEVIDVVNTGLADLQVQVPDAGSSPAAYNEIADAYDALGKRLGELSPSDGALAKAVAGYRDLTERAARQSRNYSEALAGAARSKRERRDKEARLTRLRAQAKTDLAREATVVRKLNAVCHP
jgi:hypothetical protein